MARSKLSVGKKILAGYLLFAVLAGLAGLMSLAAATQVQRTLIELAHQMEAGEENARDGGAGGSATDLRPLVSEAVHRQQAASRTTMVAHLLLCAAIAAWGVVAARLVDRPLALLNRAAAQLSQGATELDLAQDRPDDLGQLAPSLGQVAAHLGRTRDTLATMNWRHEEISKLVEALDSPEVESLADEIMAQVCTTTGAALGALYVADEDPDDPTLERYGSYAYGDSVSAQDFGRQFRVGEALVGQAARQKKPVLISNAPKDYVKITSGLGATWPRFIQLTPLVRGSTVVGVMELGLLEEPSTPRKAYLEEAAPIVALAVHNLRERRELTRQVRNAEEFVRQLAADQQKLCAVNSELQRQLATDDRPKE